ncbi:hypothetical protein GGR21_000488 [Dysgonomonas hofstadii]|uniref:Uncharacterized protein n=1 Tax=Dysgonomonas hofstadii TaxID=637886 RepID=A0A840CHA3_9BACT|nr:hypothetical protein [Dysgonomonas hofstadii]MBB4034601.1 hypothetical protein [Dysgonomonas hofstadii]
MSSKQIRYTARILLLLYIGYFSCISYFVHTHVYNGVVYVHSHPYNKWAKNANEDKQLPFETHHHTSAGFFTFNQISNITSFEAIEWNLLDTAPDTFCVIKYKRLLCNEVSKPVVTGFNLRAPPFFS